MRAKRLVGFSILLVVAGLAVYFFRISSCVPEFSADTVTSVIPTSEMGSKPKPIIGKFYLKGDKLRQEVTMLDRNDKLAKMVTIVRWDKGELLYIQPQERLSERGVGRTASVADKADWQELVKSNPYLKPVGTGSHEGYVCDKYRLSGERVYGASMAEVMGFDRLCLPHELYGWQVETSTYWVARQLGCVVKLETKLPQFTVVTELKNIRKRESPDSLFEAPEGFEPQRMVPRIPRAVLLVRPPRPPIAGYGG
ncbi:MAG TPA: hypothetical protein VMX94_09780 [Armatimonadota bacterium]|nr:hypothetical protein [Armatimonadota bacterium]